MIIYPIDWYRLLKSVWGSRIESCLPLIKYGKYAIRTCDTIEVIGLWRNARALRERREREENTLEHLIRSHVEQMRVCSDVAARKPAAWVWWSPFVLIERRQTWAFSGLLVVLWRARWTLKNEETHWALINPALLIRLLSEVLTYMIISLSDLFCYN